MEPREYIDTLFSDYQETEELDDFKEELSGYLTEQIAGFVKGGMDEDEARVKAFKELGDISQVAGEVSLRKRQEVMSEMYMRTASYITPKRGVLFALFGTLTACALLIPAAAWLSFGFPASVITASYPFALAGVLGLICMALTQETAVHEPMKGKRAAGYATAAGLLITGVAGAVLLLTGRGYATLTMLLDWLGVTPQDIIRVGTLLTLVFVLPALALGAYLLLTEKDRNKPWVKKLRREAVAREAGRFGGEAGAMRFGLVCGAVWVTAGSAFVLMTMHYGLRHSWTALAAGVVVQMIVMAAMTNPGE